MHKKIKNIANIGVIAALYYALTALLFPLTSYTPFQARVSEALTILPFFMPQAVWGLTIGCFISNLSSPFGLPDMIFGPIATFFAAFITSKVKNKYLAPLPSVIINAIVVGLMFYYFYAQKGDANALYFYIGTVGAGQMLVCYGLGLPLLLTLEKYKNKLKFLNNTEK